MTHDKLNGLTEAIVFAAGRGTRMQSESAKVLIPLNGRPMIEYVIDALQACGFQGPHNTPVFVVGYQHERVQSVVGARGRFVVQSPLTGTGDAARVAMSLIGPQTNRLIIIHGDEPLLTSNDVMALLDEQDKSEAPAVLLTGIVAETHGLGRVVRSENGTIQALVQENELKGDQRSSREINFGAYVFDRAFLESTINTLPTHAGGEQYLTDLIELAFRRGLRIESVTISQADNRIGVNEPGQLARAERYLSSLAT